MEPERSSPAIAGLAPHASLNGLLRGVVQHLLDKAPHANFFRNAVSCVVVDDYRDHVPSNREMYLIKILERTEAQYYSDVAAFRADLQLLYENAAAYNGRNGGKHAYEPVIHWAADLIGAADRELQQRSQQQEHADVQEPKLPLSDPAQQQQHNRRHQPDVLMEEVAADSIADPAAPATATANAAADEELLLLPAAAAAAMAAAPDGCSPPPSSSPATGHQCEPRTPTATSPPLQLLLPAAPPSSHAVTADEPLQPPQQPQDDEAQGKEEPEVKEEPQTEQREEGQQQPQAVVQQPQPLQPVPSGAAAVCNGGQSSPCPGANGGSAGQQSSSPSSGSGDGSHSGLEALLAACELAAEQDSATPRGGRGGGGGNSAAAATAPERRSYPGCSGPTKQQLQQQQSSLVALEGVEVARDAGAGPGLMSAANEHCGREDAAGSSEGGGMALCCVGSGGGVGGGGGSAEGVATTAPVGGSGGGGSGGGGSGAGGGGAGGSYLASNAFKNRRHKSKVYIKPNKVVYLPTTFVEEEFDVAALPLDCELRVEADGMLTDETFRVTIKAVPRQGLSTMYCMTNVMRFQQQYLNWQIYNWTRVDNSHIKIHLQSPRDLVLQRPDLDRAASMPAEVGRNFGHSLRGGSEDGALVQHHGARGGGVGGAGAAAASSSSLKRKSDTGRYNVTRVERRLVPEPGAREVPLPMELRLSSTGYLQFPSPIPESPPASPQHRISAGQAAAAAAAVLPPRAPGAPARSLLAGSQHFAPTHHHLHPSHHSQQQQPQQQQQHVQIHHHHHFAPSSHYQQGQQPLTGLALYHAATQQQQQHHHSHLHAHQHHGGGVGNGSSSGNGNPLALSFPLTHMQPRGSNSSIMTKQDQQTCSEDSSGPMLGADATAAAAAAAVMPLQLSWHAPSAAAAIGSGGGGGGRSTRLPATGAATSMRNTTALQPLELTQQQLQEVAEQLQLQAHAVGAELTPLSALQLAMAALQQQQQQQQSLLASALPRGGTAMDVAAAAAAAAATSGGGSGVTVAPLDLATPMDQERLLQQLGLGPGPGGIPQPHIRSGGHRGIGGVGSFLHLAASGHRGSSDGMMMDGDYPQRGQSNSGSLEPYALLHQHQQQQPSNCHHDEQQQHQQQQQRRSSHGDRSRHGGGGGANATGQMGRNALSAAQQMQQYAEEENKRAAADAAADAAGGNRSSEHQLQLQQQQSQQLHHDDLTVEEVEEHHIVCHPRRSASGSGLHVVGGTAGKLFPTAMGALVNGGRILLEVGSAGGGSGSAVGSRVSGSGRRLPGGPGGVISHVDLAQAGGMGLSAAFPGALDLPEYNPADIIFLSPSKRFKVAFGADNSTAATAAAAAAAAVSGGGNGELSVLDVLSLRAAAGLPVEAAALAAALRQGGGGAAAAAAVFPQAAAAALSGRPFLPVGPEIMGQLM